MTTLRTVQRKLRTTRCAYRAFGPSSLLPLARHALLRERAGSGGCELSADSTIKQRFTGIFHSNHWNTTGSTSGHGSTASSTAPYRAQLTDYLRENDVRSMLDAPCGDFSWMPLVLREVEVRYTGADIVDELVQRNRARYPDLDFRVLDITSDRLPSAEALHCRDCLFHLSYEDIASAFERMLESDVRTLLLTSFRFRRKGLNADILSGRYRFLDLTDAPIGFPEPDRWLLDFRPRIDFPKHVGVWSRDDVSGPMNRFIESVRASSGRQRRDVAAG